MWTNRWTVLPHFQPVSKYVKGTIGNVIMKIWAPWMTWSFRKEEYPSGVWISVDPCCSFSSFPGSLEIQIDKGINLYIYIAFCNKYYRGEYGKLQYKRDSHCRKPALDWMRKMNKWIPWWRWIWFSAFWHEKNGCSDGHYTRFLTLLLVARSG